MKDLYYLFIDIDECLRFHLCTGDNEICQNTPGSFSCLCAQGHRRNQQGNCTSTMSFSCLCIYSRICLFLFIDINECAESSTACDINSRCEDRNGSFACCIRTITSECIGKRV